MMLLIILLSLIVVIAFVVYFFYKPYNIQQLSENTTNIELAKAKIADLEQDLVNNLLDKEQFDSAKLDIKQTLAAELALYDNDLKFNTKSNNNNNIILVIMIFMTITSLGIYNLLGTTDIVDKLANSNLKSISTMGELEEFVANNPNNVDAVHSLAYSYFADNQLDKSNIFYQKAYKLDSKNVAIVIEYASTLAALQNNSLAGKPATLIKQALELDKNNVSALYLAGLAAYQEGQLQLVQKVWRRAIKQLPVDSIDYKTIAKQLVLLEQQISGTSDVNTQKQPQNSRQIVVSVSVTPELLTQYNLTDFVLIYAKAATGRPVPIAIKKLQLKDLPITITLTDKDAMLAQNNLTNATKILVIARLSKTGKAFKQKDDIDVSSQVIDLQKTPQLNLKLLIK